MTKISYQCCLCGNTRYEKIPFRYLFKGRFIDLMQCRSCRLRTLFPQPTAEEIEEMYSGEYFTEADKETHHGEVDCLSATTNKDYSDTINFIRGHIPNGKFLEIGCATGALLHQMKNNGFDVTGIEISNFAASYGKKHYDINIINKPFSADLIKQELSESSFDGILMGDVLEHFTNPFEAMKTACQILKEDGKLIAHVPGTLNLFSSKLAFGAYRLFRTVKTMTIPPFHLTEFSPNTLKKIFYSAGFKKVEIIHHTKHPKTIPLRHSKIENFIKLLLQYPSYYMTKWLGLPGDRMTAIGIK